MEVADKNLQKESERQQVVPPEPGYKSPDIRLQEAQQKLQKAEEKSGKNFLRFSLLTACLSFFVKTGMVLCAFAVGFGYKPVPFLDISSLKPHGFWDGVLSFVISIAILFILRTVLRGINLVLLRVLFHLATPLCKKADPKKTLIWVREIFVALFMALVIAGEAFVLLQHV